MAEIRTPQKQSYINKPIGVARASTGDAQAAQRIAQASSAYANTVMNTVNTAFKVGIEAQQTYEQEKYVNWANTVKLTPVLDENGKSKPLQMPSALSYRNRDQVNKILQRRYAEATKVETAKAFQNLRQEFKNDPDAFNAAASNYINQTANVIKNSGGIDYSALFMSEATIDAGKHYLDMKSKRAAIQDETAALNYETNFERQIDEISNRIYSGGMDSALEQAAILQAELASSTPLENGMTSRRAMELSGQLKRVIAISSITSQLDDASSAEINRVSIALQRNDLESVADLISNTNQLAPYLSNLQDRDFVRRQLDTLGGNVSKEETDQKTLSEGINGVDKKAQQATSLTLQAGMGINNVEDFVSTLQNPEQAPLLINNLQNFQALPHYVVNALEAAAQGNTIYSDQVTASLAEAAHALLYNSSGRLIGNGRGMDANTVSFVKTLQAYRNRFSDKSVSDLIEYSRSAHLQNPDYVAQVARALSVEKVTSGDPVSWAKDYLSKTGDYNARFVDKYASVYARHLYTNGKSEADDFMTEFYESFNHDYEYAYVLKDQPRERPYTPEYYYGSDTSPTGTGAVLDLFNRHVQLQLNAFSPALELGDDVLLDADPRNNDEFGKFWAVDRQGNRIKDAYQNDLVFSTKGFNAQTNLERRRQLEEQQRLEQIQAEEEKIRVMNLVGGALVRGAAAGGI
jgi:hypothetical protein